MTLATEIRKLRESRAYYAAAGAGDLAAEKLREMPVRLAKLQERADAKDLSGAAVAYVTHFGARAVEMFDDLAERGRRVMTDGDRAAGPQLDKPKAAKAERPTPELDKPAKAATRKPKQPVRAGTGTSGAKKTG